MNMKLLGRIHKSLSSIIFMKLRRRTKKNPNFAHHCISDTRFTARLCLRLVHQRLRKPERPDRSTVRQDGGSMSLRLVEFSSKFYRILSVSLFVPYAMPNLTTEKLEKILNDKLRPLSE